MTELLFVFLLGLIFGSFVNVLIIRTPTEISIVYPDSFCDSCKKKLKWYHNIPLLSWVFLRAKCAYCGSKISSMYPTIELLSAFIFLFVYLKIGFTYEMVVLSIVFCILLALSVIDIRYKAVPDSLNLTALALAVFSSLDLLIVIENLKFALLFAGAFSLLRFYVSYFKKQEAMGEADIIIASIIGAILHLELAFFCIFLSAILALIGMIIISKKDFQLPFVPFLALSLFLTFMYEKNISILIGQIYG